MDRFCKDFVEDIFLKHDKDRSNVLERKELKGWVDGSFMNIVFII